MTWSVMYGAQVVFDLPTKLRVCLEQDALAMAVSYHAGAAPILKKYGNDALAAIATEVDAAMELVLRRLHARLKDEQTSAAAAAECMELLAQAGEPHESIQVRPDFLPCIPDVWQSL